MGATLFLTYDKETEQNSRYQSAYQTILRIFSSDGTVLDEIRIVVRENSGTTLEEFCPGKSNLGNVSFLDGERLFIDGWCWNFRTHQKEWELDIRNHSSLGFGIDITPPCRLLSGRLASAYNDDRAGFLISFLPDGSEQIVQELPSPRHWDSPIVFDDKLYLACENQLFCYNSALEELWHVSFEESVGLGSISTHVLDADMKILYMSAYQSIIAFDLQKREIHAVREIAEGEGYLCDSLRGAGPIILTGNSSFEVWDPELKTISRHRVKGRIDSYWLSSLRAFFHQEGKTYLPTRTDPYYKPFILRLYELKPPKTV